MSIFRAVLVGIIVSNSLLLCGFKKQVKKHSSNSIKHAKPLGVTEQQKILDLSVPETLALSEEAIKNNDTSQQADDAFFKTTSIKPRPLEVKGQVIMSQEPEAGKTKSADGAGLMINLRP
jgi:hypothetical protein